MSLFAIMLIAPPRMHSELSALEAFRTQPRVTT